MSVSNQKTKSANFQAPDSVTVLMSSFVRLYRRQPASIGEYQAYLYALDLKIRFNNGALTVGEVRTQLEKIEGAEEHYLAIVKAETEKQQREQNT